MHIGTQRVSPYPASTEPKLPSENNADPADAVVRHKRSINSSSPNDQELVQEVRLIGKSPGRGFEEVSVNPDPGKRVGLAEKVPPSTLPDLNINVDPAVREITDSFNSVEQEAANFLKKKFAEFAQKAKSPADKEQWDIDPDNTFLVTFDYNTTGERPYPAKVIQRISLTQALIQNAQATPAGQGYEVPFYPGGPEVIVKPDLKTLRPATFDLSSRFNPNRELANNTHTFQGIYKESAEEPAPVYNGVSQSSITPAEFKKLIWKADFQQPYKAFLDEFWTHHLDKYPVLAKASFIQSAMAQRQEGSLTPQGRELIMRAAGMSGNQASWPDIQYEDLQKNPPNDPNIELGLIKLGSYQSTDLVYITDTKSTPALTLLYIPGNSSPIHSFSSQAEMKQWLATQMADPTKRAAMALHFALKDKPNGFARAGIDETLAGLGSWPEKRETPGGLLNYDHRAFTGFWDPQTFITTEPHHLPFDEIAKRQKNRSYADADVQITSDADQTKKAVLSALEKSTKVALFLTPLALVMPEVALVLDAFYLADGVTTTVIGIDDTVHGKPTGTERIAFGVFNAATVVIPHIARGGKAAEGAAGEIESNALHVDDKPAPTAPEPSHLQLPDTSRQLPDFSAYAMPDNFLEGRTLRGDGTYQVGERFFVRYTDGTGVSRVFEISRNYKTENGYVRAIHPATGKTAMFLESAGNGEWRLNTMKGGGKKTITHAPQRKPLSQDNAIPRASTDQSLINHQDWQSIVDSGMYNGQPVYIHYTDKAGAEAIARGQAINDAARGATREGSKGGVYVNPPGQQFNSENVEDLLFLGNERYVGRGDYMVIFSTDQVPQELGAITAGSPFVELKMPRDIKLAPSNFLYLGPNKFPNYFG
ncbi:dermonecrotic toxin domain-containing protein [Pseudomonas sp. AMR01]|uniref:dermonecrotic toxin domain-containing protein n=1 Tax=Pseudomonas sp. AMR01 TaxID=3064904 RepID=UPI0035C13A5B